MRQIASHADAKQYLWLWYTYLLYRSSITVYNTIAPQGEAIIIAFAMLSKIA